MTDWMPKTTPAEMLARINAALDSGRTVIIGNAWKRTKYTAKTRAKFDAAGIALFRVENNPNNNEDIFCVYDGHRRGVPRYAGIFTCQLEQSVRIY